MTLGHPTSPNLIASRKYSYDDGEFANIIINLTKHQLA